MYVLLTHYNARFGVGPKTKNETMRTRALNRDETRCCDSTEVRDGDQVRDRDKN